MTLIPLKYQKLFWDKVDTSGDCWVWTASRNRKGYGEMGIGGNKIRRAHRISYEIHKGEIPEGMCVCHTCDNPSCVNPDHLWIGTHQDNAIDREAKNRGGRKGPLGSKAPASKLTEELVVHIKALLREGRATQREIAARFGVHFASISDIATGKTWRHVNP